MKKAAWNAAWIIGLLALGVASAAADRDRGTGLAASHVVIDPQNPKIIYVPSTFYGVYKSADGGETWRLLNKGVGAPDFYALAVHPKDSRQVFVGAAGGGIYRTEDGGESWTESNTGLSDTSVYDIVFDPKDPSVMHVLTLREVFKSRDTGRSWKPVFTENPGFLDPSYHRRMLVVPGPKTVFLVATATRGFRRAEGDANWSTLDGPLNKAKVSAYAFHPASNSIVAGAINSEGLFKSLDGGVTWTPFGGGLSMVGLNRIVPDPSNPKIFYLATKNRGVLKSEDGGDTWNPINEGMPELDVKGLALNPQNPQQIFIGTYNKGIYSSSDGGLHWSNKAVPLFPTWPELNKMLTRKIQSKPGAPPPPASFVKCQPCHAWTDPILNGPTRETFWRTFPSGRDWRPTMDRMEGHARLTAEEKAEILSYLNAQYGTK